MQNYTTIEIHSYTILLLFFFYFLLKILGVWRSMQNKSLLHRNRTLKKLKRLSWDDFERLCMELFTKLGWIVVGNEKKGADGGVDIWMEKTSLWAKNTTAIVQCKRYEDASVTVKVVREMYGLMHEHDVDEVYIVTTSQFTKECYGFVEGKKIRLINANVLVQLIERYT